MITFMSETVGNKKMDGGSDILCVTNRTLCREDFLTRVARIAAARPAGILLREKDLSEADYETLARQMLSICTEWNVPCVLHSFPAVAHRLGCDALHLPLHLLSAMPETERRTFRVLGASCHSPEDAMEAERLGCTYITAGHVFVTDCKKGLAPRGLDFLRQTVQAVNIPVWAIGGIHADNIADVRKTGAAGGCVMSGLMTCESPTAYLRRFETGKTNPRT
jgi:thiamine-phosphate pyrophosphorylase